MMFNTLRYPTKQQGIIWLGRRQKGPPTDIARDLHVELPLNVPFEIEVAAVLE
ncbi:MAG: hypothetical protein ACFFD9_04585 [Candidatus Thorarchaeota archaeon]